MTGISVGFTIVIPGSLDPDMHFGLEVKWLRDKAYPDYLQPSSANPVYQQLQASFKTNKIDKIQHYRCSVHQ